MADVTIAHGDRVDVIVREDKVMPSVNTTPDDIRKVANAIAAAEQEIQAAVSKMEAALQGADWQDTLRTRFDSDFQALIRGLKAFQQIAPSTVQHLQRKAQQLDDFLNH